MAKYNRIHVSFRKKDEALFHKIHLTADENKKLSFGPTTPAALMRVAAELYLAAKGGK